jgi:hypothetical protein
VTTRQGICLALASAALLGATAGPAAADTVGNPGSISANFGGFVSLGGPALGFFDQSLAPLQLGGAIDSDGALTGGWTNTWEDSNTLSPADAFGNPSAMVSWSISQQHLTMHSGDLTGSIDPATGEASLELPVYGTLTAHLDYSALGVSGSATLSCTEGSAATPVAIPLSTTGSVNPPQGPSPVEAVPYDPTDGGLTLVSGAFTSPNPDCSGGGSFSALSFVYDYIKQELIGSSGAGSAWAQGAFTPAITAPAPPPPPPPPTPPTPPSGGATGTGTGTGGQQPSGGGQPSTPAAAKCTVPKLSKVTLSSARRKLTAAHCKLGKVSHRHSKTVKSGRVLSQGSKPGSSLPAESAVRLTVSSGAPPKHRPHR